MIKTIAVSVLLLVVFVLFAYGYGKRRIAVAKAPTADVAEVQGGCHCGKVRFEATVEPKPEMLDCNCSICQRTGHLHLFIQHENFVLLSGKDVLASYKFGSGQADHMFCSHCGVKSFYQPRSHPDAWSVNYHCLDEGHRLEPAITKFDGQNWEAAKAGFG